MSQAVHISANLRNRYGHKLFRYSSQDRARP